MAVVILEHLLLRHRRGPIHSVGPQPQVDAIGDPQIGRLRDQPHRLLHHPFEELGVRAGLGSLHAAIGGMNEDEVDVAGVVELLAAELPQRDHRETGPLTRQPARNAPQLLHPRQRRRDRRPHHAVGDVGDLRDHRLQPLPADDVAVGDAERLTAFEPAERPHDAVGLREQRRLRGQRRSQRLAALGPPLAHSNLLPRLRIEDHQFGEVGAGGKELHQDLQASRIALEERTGGERAADGADEPLDRDEHPVGIARGWKELPEPTAEKCQEIERQPVRSQTAERAVGDRRIREAGPAAPLRRGGGLVEEPLHLRHRTGKVRRHGLGSGGRIGRSCGEAS